MKRLALVLLVACSSKKAEDKPAAGPKLDRLEVSIDGTRLAIDRAFLRHPSPDVYDVVLGAGKGSCTEDGTLGFTIKKRLAASGQASLSITDVYSREHDLKLLEPIAVTLDGTKLALPRGAMGKLVMAGDAELVDCPPYVPTGNGAPKVPHKADARITVAGNVVDIRGVTVQTRAGVAATDLPDITISTNVLACGTITPPAPVILMRRDKKWTLRGTWFEGNIAETDAQGLAFNANDVGKSIDGPTLQLQLQGTGKLGDFTVKLEGTVEAVECVR